MSFSNFRLNLFAFTIDGLEIMFSYFVVTRLTCCYTIMITRTTLDGFTVGNAEGSTTSAKRYFIIKRTLFALKKRFAITSNKRRHYYMCKKNREPSVLIFMCPLISRPQNKI